MNIQRENGGSELTMVNITNRSYAWFLLEPAALAAADQKIWGQDPWFRPDFVYIH